MCCIYPVTPFLNSEDLIKSFNLIVKRDCDFVFSAGQHRQAIKRSFRIKEDGAPRGCARAPIYEITGLGEYIF